MTVKMTNVMMMLRKCCNHPFLNDWPLDRTGELEAGEPLAEHSGKMQLLDRLLPALKAKGHRVLIFSQFSRMLDILEDYMSLRGHDCCRLDGTTSYADRRDAMDSFNRDKGVFAFLLTTRAGGLGINLVGGDTVIIYDSDWNPQCDLQAMDRCHRIGQTKAVIVYRMITANTVDQKVLERAEAKRKLEKLVIQKGRFKGHVAGRNPTIGAEELLELLNEAVPDAQDAAAAPTEIISDAELAMVLDRGADGPSSGASFRVASVVESGKSVLSKLSRE